MRAAWPIAMFCVACGRIGFDPVGGEGNGDGRGDGGMTPGDGKTQPIACADVNLGSVLGAVAMGTTATKGDELSGCGSFGEDVSYGWVAPATGMYTIDTCGSSMTLDTVLYVRDGDCMGTQLACNDDACGAFDLSSRVSVNLTAGQPVVVVIDEAYPGAGGGMYQLAITRM